MSSGKTAPSRTAEARLLTRVLDEAYGSGAWHGPDLKAALGDVAPEVAFWRPSPERHNLAEVAFRFDYSGCCPAQNHCSTVPPFDAARSVAHPAEQILDRIVDFRRRLLTGSGAWHLVNASMLPMNDAPADENES